MFFKTVGSMIAAAAVAVLVVPNAAQGQTANSWDRFAEAFADNDQTIALTEAVDDAVGNDVDQTLKEYDEAIKRLDEAVAELDAEKIEEIESDLSDLSDAFDKFSGDKTIVHSGSSASTMKVSGRIHADYWSFPETSPGIDQLEGGPFGPQARLGFRRVRFGVAGDLTSNMLYKIEMEFAGGNDAEFRDVYLGWKELPLLRTLLLGNQKRPYGLDHLNSSRYNVFLERPFVIEGFNQDARRFGLCSYGVSEDERWNWRYGVYNQRLIQDEGNYIGDNLQMEFASRLANTIWYDEVSGGRGYAHWAVSGSYASPAGNRGGDVDGTGPFQNEARFRTRPEARSATRWLDTGRIAGTEDYNLLGLEGVANFGPLQLVTEWQQVWLNRDNGVGTNLEFWGAYFYAAYFLTGEHMPWERDSGTLGRPKPFENFFLVNRCRGGVGGGWGAWQVAARYSYADFNDDDILGGIGESLTIGLNWYWTANARMQFNWLHGKITDNGFTRAPAVLSGNYDIVGTRFMVDF